MKSPEIYGMMNIKSTSWNWVFRKLIILMFSIDLAEAYAADTIFVTRVDTVYIEDVVVKEQPNAEVKNALVVLDTAMVDVPRNNWGAKLKESPVHLDIYLQTKYVWRGIEMIVEKVSPVIFPSVNFQWEGLFIYAMGGYSLNGNYSELDLGISYTWKGLSIGLNDYFYPENYSAYDKYFTGGKESKHWLEVCLSYTPKKAPIWITASNFFYSPTDVYVNEAGEEKKAYSTYLEVGLYYDFLQSNRISIAVGMTPYASWYNNYQEKFSVCNLDMKYTYTIHIKKNEWELPLSAELVYNPIYEKPYFNLIANLAF